MKRYEIKFYDYPVDGKMVWSFVVECGSREEAEYIGRTMVNSFNKEGYCFSASEID